MIEIELKVLEIKPEDEEKKLLEHGFTKIWEGIILEKFFDTKKRALKKQKKILRLRNAYEQVELTYKEKGEKHPFLKFREEREIIVNSFKSTEELLEGLGYTCVVAREKKRISYKLKNVNVDIDEYPGAKPYMEIEGSEKEVEDMLKKLNHTLKKTSKKSSTQILKSYNLNSNELFF